MTALVGVELRRLLSRRLTRGFALLALLGIVIAGTVVFLRSHRDLGAAVEQARIEREKALRECISGEAFEIPPELRGPGFDREATCENAIGDEARDPRFRLEELTETFKGTTGPIVIAAWLLAASFIGAEWHAGTIATTLTWEPRRVRLFVAKALAAVVVAFAGTVGVQALLGGAVTPAAVLRGTTAGTDAAWFRELAGVVLRGAALASLASLIGFSIAAIGRYTAAALGVGFLYLGVLEGIIRGLRPGWIRWLVGDNAVTLVAGREMTFPATGRTALRAGLLLSAYALGAFAVAAALFRARDVT